MSVAMICRFTMPWELTAKTITWKTKMKLNLLEAWGLSRRPYADLSCDNLASPPCKALAQQLLKQAGVAWDDAGYTANEAWLAELKIQAVGSPSILCCWQGFNNLLLLETTNLWRLAQRFCILDDENFAYFTSILWILGNGQHVDIQQWRCRPNQYCIAYPNWSQRCSEYELGLTHVHRRSYHLSQFLFLLGVLIL